MLKNGAIVKTKNGKFWLKIDNTLILLEKEKNGEGVFLTTEWMPFDEYDEDFFFKDGADEGYNIVSILNDVDNVRGYCNQAIHHFIFGKYEELCEAVNKEYELTNAETAIISSLDEKWKYIARDEDGRLFIFTAKPEKYVYCSVWVRGEDYKGESSYFPFPDLFKFISWSDSEPVLIKNLLK